VKKGKKRRRGNTPSLFATPDSGRIVMLKEKKEEGGKGVH